MDAATLIGLYGTNEKPAASRRLVAGPLAVELAGGAVRSVVWKGVEVLRGIDYPVRNADWGTYPQATVEETADESREALRYRRRFTAADGAIAGEFTLEGTPDSLTAQLTLTSLQPLNVNRAGFVVLHPVAGVAGTPLAVTHPDGAVEHTAFPELISPGQPVFDIAGLTQSANGVTTEIVFSGEVFEMEDQRNWSDASYKTYCRPLRLPYPYEIGPDQPVQQSIALRFSGDGAPASSAGADTLRLGGAVGTLPEVTLSLEPGWEAEGPAIETLAVGATRVRIDLTDRRWHEQLEALLAAARGAVDLELVTPDEAGAMEAAVAEAAAVLAARREPPRLVIALPAAYLKSYQPDARWPDGATPTQAAAAVRRHFPQSRVMGGMLTNLTELNRHRAAAAAGDVLTHGTTAIVHAADDVSVMQTLEALPQIFASAAALAPGKPYHLGLVAIGMRSNPYGSGLAPNRDAVRRTMADADPRQRGLFAAAWMVGATAATEGTAVSGLSLAAPAGPTGLVENGTVRPAYHVFRFLAGRDGRERLAVATPPGLAAVAVREGNDLALALANLTPAARSVAIAGRHLVLPASPVPHDWLETATPAGKDQVDLGPYGVAFLWTGATEGLP